MSAFMMGLLLCLHRSFKERFPLRLCGSAASAPLR